MESSHLVPLHIGSAFLHLDCGISVFPSDVQQEELPVEATPVFHVSPEPPSLVIAYQLCSQSSEHVEFAKLDTQGPAGVLVAVENSLL